MTMIDRDVPPEPKPAFERLMERAKDVLPPATFVKPGDIGRMSVEAMSKRAPKHRADVEPAVVQCCGECVTCNVCGEPVT